MIMDHIPEENRRYIQEYCLDDYSMYYRGTVVLTDDGPLVVHGVDRQDGEDVFVGSLYAGTTSLSATYAVQDCFVTLPSTGYVSTPHGEELIAVDTRKHYKKGLPEHTLPYFQARTSTMFRVITGSKYNEVHYLGNLIGLQNKGLHFVPDEVLCARLSEELGTTGVQDVTELFV